MSSLTHKALYQLIMIHNIMLNNLLNYQIFSLSKENKTFPQTKVVRIILFHCIILLQQCFYHHAELLYDLFIVLN